MLSSLFWYHKHWYWVYRHCIISIHKSQWLIETIKLFSFTVDNTACYCMNLFPYHYHLPPWVHGEPLFYRTSTTDIVIISPSILMSALFVYSCLTHDYCNMYWMHYTSWGSCWWSFSCFSLLESGIQNVDSSPKGLCWVVKDERMECEGTG